LAAGFGDLGHNLFRACRACGIVDDDMSAFSSQTNCNRGSDAARRSSDKSKFIFQWL
jgi:hypothetical protein